MTVPARRALEQLSGEARRLEIPEIDWDRVEAGLQRQIEGDSRRPSGTRPVQVRRGSVFWPLLVGAGAVATAVLWWSARAPQPHAPPEPTVAATVTDSVDGSALALGERLRTHERSLTVRHAGHAVWKLAPKSEAVLESRGDVVRVRLEAGLLTAQVEPRPRAETFVVLAGDARVAVRGTEFSVRLSGDGVNVRVLRGSVRVTSLGNHRPARLLSAPSEQRFRAPRAQGSKVAGPGGAAGPAVASEPAPLARSTSRARSARGSSAVSADSGPGNGLEGAALQEEPTVTELERGIDRITAAVEDCLLRKTTPGQEVRLVLDSTLMLEVAPTGAVASHAFDPPLAPEVETCSRAAVDAVEFAPSQRGLKVLRRLELSR